MGAGEWAAAHGPLAVRSAASAGFDLLSSCGGALTSLGLAGWVAATFAAVVAARQRRRLELVADAAHELRGPAAALVFAIAALRRQPGGAVWAARLDGQLDRFAAGLADLDAARSGRWLPGRTRTVALERVVRSAVDSWRVPLGASGRTLELRWEAGRVAVVADPGRLAQALGNLLANAAEHGEGPVAVTVFGVGAETVRIEVRDAGAPRPGRRGAPAPGRGRGLRIAARAVRAAGGRLALEHHYGGTTATIELPRTAGPLPARGRGLGPASVPGEPASAELGGAPGAEPGHASGPERGVGSGRRHGRGGRRSA